MRQTRLVLFEGIPGSGKSTTGQFLARHLMDQGILARWWYEEEAGHPVWLFNDLDSLQHLLDRLSSGDVSGVVSDALDRWRQFAQAQQHADAVVLLDSCLLGYLTWTLFPGEVPPEDLRAYLAEVERIISPLDPCLVYFRQRDVGASLRRLLDRRGGGIEDLYTARVAESAYGRRRRLHGFDGLAAFWTAYRDFADGAVAAVGFPTLVLETDAGDWTTYQYQLLAFLGVPLAAADAGSPGDLARYVGIYRERDNGEDEVCHVRIEDGALYLFDLPHVWPRTKLLPKTHDTFDVESFPFEATFSSDAAGVVATMTVTGPTTAFRRVDWVFRKVPSADGRIDGSETA